MLQADVMTDFVYQRNLWCGLYLILVFISMIVQFLKKLFYTYTGENLTLTLRNMLFEGIVYKQLEWFDHKERAPGILSNIISEEIS